MYFHYIYNNESKKLRVLEYPSNRIFYISQHKIMTKKYNHNYALPKKYSLLAKEKYQMTKKELDDYYKRQLIQFSQDFQKFNDELKYNGFLRIDYTKYYCDSLAITSTFKRLCPKVGLLKPVDMSEYAWINNCNRGGLVYFNDNEKNSVKQCYGYDFQKFYPFCMTKVKIPLCSGEPQILEQLPEKKLHFGYYRLYVRCENEKIKRVFSFSTNNIYTNYSLHHLRFLQKETSLKIEFGLIQDGKPNAYLYRDEDLISGQDLFGNWYEKLTTIEDRLKTKNLLLKHLMSRLWGCLISSNKRYLNGDEFAKENIPMSHVLKHTCHGEPLDPKETFTFTVLSDPSNVFKHGGVGRLGNFLIEYCRCYIGTFIAKRCLDSIIKIQTDGFVTTERVKYNKKQGYYHLLKFDMKYYGKFKIGKGINDFEKIISS